MKLTVSDEVRTALSSKRPVVALESSVIAQGLPSPHNLDTARACEAAVRGEGAVPATIALLDGIIHVGLSGGQVERLASGEKGLRKVGSRDLALACLQGASGGTTVSATCEIAAAAGLRVFATGGIGGVHRGASQHFDISQDLWALATFPVAVVCAGAKSVLDLPKTMEALETVGVPVVGLRTRELPNFYSKSSGIPLEHSVDDETGAAALIRMRYETLGQRGGLLFCQPPPEDVALPAEEIERLLGEALSEAARQNIQGKAVTPFLLSELSRRSHQRTLTTNMGLIRHNAVAAARISVALCQC